MQSVAALAFATNKLALGVAFHRCFANQAALAIEAGTAATRAERLAWIGNRPRQFRATTRVAAERLYRLAMKSDPTDASAPFSLGNILRAAASTVEAEAALRTATRANPAFAEAWYNLAGLLDDQGRSEAAVECFRKALVVAPDYADAMFNLALLAQRKDTHGEAADYWRRYLARDRSSEWVVQARRSLKFCEIQVN